MFTCQEMAKVALCNGDECGFLSLFPFPSLLAERFGLLLLSGSWGFSSAV